MATTITQTMEVSLPGAGKIQTYALTADTPVKFMFDLSDAIFTGVNGNLEIVVEGGGTVILENYQAFAEAGTLPTFEMLDGEQIAGEVYLFAFGEDVEGVTQEDLETAAGAAATGSGAGEYSDDAGTLYDGLDALGGQDDAYDSTAIEPLEEIIPAILEEEEERIPPVAVDDDNETVEEGQDYGESIYTSFDQIPFTSIVEGNLLFNDYDDDNIGYEDQDPSYQQTPPDPLGIIELEVNSIDFDGEDQDGLNPGPVSVEAGGTTVKGLYGELTVYPNGEYSYVLDQELADPLRDGQEITEVFPYNIIDPDGLVSNTATLTILITGTNDPPVAINDTSALVTEEGPEVVGIAVAAGNVLHNDWDVDNVGYEDLPLEYRDQLPPDPDGLVELSVTSIYNPVTHQYDSTPDSGAFTVEGMYGTLVINTDGSYEYTLDQSKADPLAQDERAVDTFQYSMWDGQLSSYANLIIPILGTNDAPVAVDNIDSVYEPNVDALAILAAGNVITDSYDHDSDPSTPAVDFDVDDPSGLSLQDVTYGGVTKVFGVNEEPGQTYIQFTTDNGVVRFWSDGEYEYTATNDALDLGDAPVEAFDYTLTDGSLTDTATLNITIHGLNDPPSLDLDDDLGGVNYVGTYTENDPAVALTDSSIIADVDADALISKATISYTPLETEDEAALNLNLAGDWQAVRSESGGVVTWTVTNTGGDQSLATYQSVLDGMTFGNPADEDPMAGDRVFTVTVYDEHDAASNPATSTITVEAVNDAPVAVHDGYHEISIDLVPLEGFDQFQGFNGHQHVEDNMYFLPQSDSGGNVQMRTAEGSGNRLLGVLNDFGSSSVDDHSVDNINGNDSLFVQFIEPQKGAQPDPEDVPFLREGQARIEVHLQETGYAPFNGASIDIYILDPSDTNPTDGQDIMYYKTVEFNSLDFTLDSAVHNDGLLIYGVALKPSGTDSAFWLDGIFSGPPEYELNLGSAANNSGEIEGNLLLNDFDIEDPASLHVADVGGNSVSGSGSVVIEGTYGQLTIEADGDYWYRPYDAEDPGLPAGAVPWQSLTASVTEVFEYTVADGGAQIDTGFLEFSISMGTEHIEGGTAPDPLMGTNIDDVIFPADADVIYSGAGSDSIVIDPEYLGGNGDTINIMDFSDSDQLSLGNMEGASVLITSTSTDVHLQFSDIDGSDDIVVNLMGVNPVDKDHFELVEITTSENLNTLIQTIIDTGNDGIA